MSKAKSKTFDTTLNSIVELGLTDWATYLAGKIGVPVTGAVGDDDTDISDQAFPDKVFTVGGLTPYLIHVEFESSSHLGVPGRLHEYNARLTQNSGKPVYSVLVLLRPRAAASDQTGHFVAPGILGETIHTFSYTVVRVWRESVDSLLAAGPAFLPLALLTDEANTDFASAFERFRTRLSQPDVPHMMLKDVAGYAYTMCGLRYTPNQLRSFFMGIRTILEDSTTAQEFLLQGEARGVAKGVAMAEAEGLERAKTRARGLLVKQGRKRFGASDAAAEAAVNAIDDLDRLDRMAEALLDVTSWAELLTTT